MYDIQLGYVIIRLYMVRQEPFTEHEAVLLLDAFLCFEAGKCSRKDAIQKCSEELRQMAKVCGMTIDDTYRNINGITFQITSMDSAYRGKTIMKPSTRLFSQTMDKYRNDRKEYERLLGEVRSMLESKKNNEEEFMAWLSKKVSAAQLSELYMAFLEIERQAKMTRIIEKSLYENIDLTVFKKVKNNIEQSKLFKFKHKRQMGRIHSALNFLIQYAQEMESQEDVTTLDSNEIPAGIIDPTPTLEMITRSISNTDDRLIAYKKHLTERVTQPISNIKERCNEEASEEASIPSEVVEGSESLKVDFRCIAGLAHTKPISFAYFDEVQANVSNWTQLYTQVLVCLSEDYPAEFIRMYNTNISAGRQIDFGTKKVSEQMIAPKKVSDNFYVESNLSATDIMMKIRILLDRCNVDYENLEVYYIKLESTQYTEPSSVENTSKSAASVASATMSTVVVADTGNYKELFRNWLVHDQHMAKRSAQNYSSAVTNCEQLASKLGLTETNLYGVDFIAAERVVDRLRQTAEYRDVNACQHNRYNAACTKYLMYLQRVSRQEVAVSFENSNEFDKLFKDEKHKLLYVELRKNGITTLEELKGVNLWSFMNLHQLYPIQQRLAISTELTAELRNAGKEHSEQHATEYEIRYNGDIHKGGSPAEAFAAFLSVIAAKYPLKFRALLNVYNPVTHRIVVSRNESLGAQLKLINPESYVDSGLSSEEVKLYVNWVIERCGASPKEYSVKEKQKSTDTPAENSQKMHEQTDESPAAVPASSLMRKAENYLLQCDLTGATYDELQNKLCYTMMGTKEIVVQSPYIIEMNHKLYHEEALVDFEEGADTLEAVLDKLLKKNNGIATAKHLYEYARSEMAMFFNDNGITDQQSVYDLARHLFEKLKYHGKHYAFKSNMYISLPEFSADSVIDIVSKYAREKGTTVTYDEIVRYLAGLGSNTGNLRGLMRIDKEPVFLVYAENEYMLAELMHIDADFLESVHGALRRLFADADGHIIPRNISESWYNLLPTLPACLPWTPMLLQQLIRFYPDELEARTIIAMESQSSNTLHAMFVEKDSWIQDFRDVVAVFLHNEMSNRYEFEAEELRGIMVDAGMISGNQLIYNMPNALGGDPRFLWDSDGSYVKVRI